MHVLALSLSLGLAVLFVGRWVTRLLPEALRRFDGMATLAIGVLAAWLADFDAWDAWGVPVREQKVGIVLTGLGIGGLAIVWGELLGLLHRVAGRADDQAEGLERSRDLRAAS